MEKWVVVCRNRGIWGGRESFLKSNGEVLYFDTEEQARSEADEIRSKQGCINNFNSYFVRKVMV